MNALMKPNDVPLTMTSLEIADLVESRHDNVKITIERLGARGVIQLPALQEVKNHLGQTVKVYPLGKRDSYVVVAQLCPEFTARLVDRWQELEARVPAPVAMTRMEILRIAMESEQARIEAEAQRDEAVRTKALIGSKREATAMAKASAAVREVKRLTEELGRNAKHATITAVENALGRRLGKQDWVPLRRYCKSNGLQAEKVHDPRWGEATAWPAEAWNAVYGIDLHAIFPDPQAGMH